MNQSLKIYLLLKNRILVVFQGKNILNFIQFLRQLQKLNETKGQEGKIYAEAAKRFPWKHPPRESDGPMGNHN